MDRAFIYTLPYPLYLVKISTLTEKLQWSRSISSSWICRKTFVIPVQILQIQTSVPKKVFWFSFMLIILCLLLRQTVQEFILHRINWAEQSLVLLITPTLHGIVRAQVSSVTHLFRIYQGFSLQSVDSGFYYTACIYLSMFHITRLSNWTKSFLPN